MGIAIIWIVLYHFGINFPILGRLIGSGFVGVDIFIFLSGFGLFYSLSKGGFQWGKYIHKRVIRIFPAYFIVGIFLSVFCYNDNFLEYLWKCSTLGFWTNGNYYDWFIPSLLALYVLYPILYFSFLQKEDTRSQIYLIILCLFLSYLCVIFFSFIDNWHFLLIYRIPIFIFGSLVAYYIKRNKTNSYFLYPALIGIILFTILIFINHSDIRYYYFSLTFLTPLIIVLFISFCKKVSIANRCFAIIGGCTLEIYLVHLIFLKYLRVNDIPLVTNYHNLSTILLCIVSLFLGYTLNKIINVTKSKLSIQ